MMGDDTFSVVSGSTNQGSTPLLFSTLRGALANNHQDYHNDGTLSPVIPSQNIDDIQALKNDILESRLSTDLLMREDSEKIPLDSQTDLFESQQSLNNIDSSAGRSSGVPSVQSEAKSYGACNPHNQKFSNLMNTVPDVQENGILAEGRAGRSFAAEEDSKSISSQSTLPPVEAVPLIPGIQDVLELQGSSQKLKDGFLPPEFKPSPPDISSNIAHEPGLQYLKDNMIEVSSPENLRDAARIPTTLSFHSSMATAYLYKESISQSNSRLEKPTGTRQKYNKSNSVGCDNAGVGSPVSDRTDTCQRNEQLINRESKTLPIDLKSRDDPGAIKNQTKSLQIHQTEVDTLCRLIKIYDMALKKIDHKKPTAAHLDKLQHITQQLAKGQEEERVRLSVLSTKIHNNPGADAVRKTSKYGTKLNQLKERQALLSTAQSHHRKLLQRISGLSSIEGNDKTQHCVAKEFTTVENCQSSRTNRCPVSPVGPPVTELDRCPVVKKHINDNSSRVEVSSSVCCKRSPNQHCLTPRRTQYTEEHLVSADQPCNENDLLDISKRADGLTADGCIQRNVPLQACAIVSVSSQSNESDLVSPTDGSGGREVRHAEHNDTLHLFTDHCYIGSVQKEEDPPSTCSVSSYCMPTQPVVVSSIDPCDSAYIHTLSSDHWSSEFQGNATNNKLVTYPDTASGWPETAHCAQTPVEEQIEVKTPYGDCLNSQETACNDYLGDVALVLEVPGNDCSVQGVADDNISLNQGGSEKIQPTQSYPEDKHVGPALQDGKQETSNLTFIETRTDDAIRPKSVTVSQNFPVSLINRSSHPPSPSSTVSSSFFPVSSKELMRRIEIRSAGQPFWHLKQPTIGVECHRQPFVNLNVAQTPQQHIPPKHTLPLAADADCTAKPLAKKLCMKEHAPGIKSPDQLELTSQPFAISTVDAQRHLAIPQFSQNLSTQTTDTSKCVTFHGLTNVRKQTLQPLRKRGRPKKENTCSGVNNGSSKNRKTNTQNIRKYFPIVIECSPVKCSDSVEPLSNSLGVSERVHVNSLTLGDEAGATLPVTTDQPDESDSAAGNLETVVLIADAEVTNSSGDFPDFFWQENFANVTMSMAFWDSLDSW